MCDEVDNNCNTTVDEGLPTTTFHRDADGDGVGVAGNTMVKCRAPAGFVAPTAAFDCDDTKPEVKPGATEVCNNIDDNCASGIDEGFNKSWYRDADMDTYGLQSNMQTNCVQPAGFVASTSGFDCDDTRATVCAASRLLCVPVPAGPQGRKNARSHPFGTSGVAQQSQHHGESGSGV